MYLAWAAFYEGSTDAAYFDVLLPRVMDDILLAQGTRPVQVPAAPAVYLGRTTREVGMVAEEICRECPAFHILFIHADTGGRVREDSIATRREAFAEEATDLCAWPSERAAFLSPRHEMEAWAIADGEAVCRALGFNGTPGEIGLPRTAAEAERLADPKQTLEAAARSVSERAYRHGAVRLLPLVAQEQTMDTLRGCPSFQDFEASLQRVLRSLGCL